MTRSLHAVSSDLCALCSSGKRTSPLLVGSYTYAICGKCGAGRLDPPPDLSPAAYYNADYFTANRTGGYADYQAEEVNHRCNAAERLDRIETWSVAPASRHLIDFGCASGFVLAEARQRGWTAAGVDVSDWARDRARGVGHEVYATLTEAVAKHQPDVVTFFQVLEHLHDPASALATAAASLPSGGLLVIETWNRHSWVARVSGKRWQQLAPPSVIHLFTLTGLRAAVRTNGLETVWADGTSKRVSPTLLMGFVAQHFPRSRVLLERVASSRLARIGLPYRLGDLVTFIARKP